MNPMAEKSKHILGTKGGKHLQVKHSDSKKDVQQTKKKAPTFSLPSIAANEHPSETSLNSLTELLRCLPKQSKTSKSPPAIRKLSSKPSKPSISPDTLKTLPKKPSKNSVSPQPAKTISLNRVNAKHSPEVLRKVSLNRANAGQSPEAARKVSLNRVNAGQSPGAVRKVSQNRVNSGQSPEVVKKVLQNRVNAGKTPEAVRKVPLNQTNTTQPPETVVRKVPLNRTKETLPQSKLESETLNTKKAELQTTEVSLSPDLKGTYSSKLPLSYESLSDIPLQSTEASLSFELPKEITSKIQQSCTSISDVPVENWNIPTVLRIVKSPPSTPPTTKRSISKIFEVPGRKRNSLTTNRHSISSSKTGAFTKSRTELNTSKSNLQNTPSIEAKQSDTILSSTQSTEKLTRTSNETIMPRVERNTRSRNEIIYERADFAENKNDDPTRDKAPIKDHGSIYRKYYGLLSSYRSSSCVDPEDKWHSKPLPVKEFKRELRRRSLLNGWPDKSKFYLGYLENDSTFIENQRKMHEETIAMIREKHGDSVASLIDEDLPSNFNYIMNYWLKDDNDKDTEDDLKRIDDVYFNKINSLTDNVEHIKEKLGLEKTPSHPEISNAAIRETKSKKKISAKKKKAREAVAASKMAFLKLLNGEQ